MSKRRGFKFASDDGEETANDILDDQQQDEVIDTFKERSERMKAETLIMVRAVALALGIG
ncbi:hypothetical protein HDU84_009369 [Entophlyctis sp. JEL0112]|nr:hypothetical protein HDU84_009369 [Entophlyctis sp. JEL0112]